MASEDLPANGHGGPADPKSALRTRYRAARRAFVAGLAPADRRRLEGLLGTLLDARLPMAATAAYAPVGSEVDPRHVARALLYPRVTDGPLAFEARTDVPPSRRGPAIPSTVPVIVLVPLLAVDRRGNRLGQGGGHYDRTLATLRRTGRVLAVGVAWDMQVVEALPCDPWDEPLDALATPSAWRDFTRG